MLGINNTVFTGYRNKALHILHFPVLFLHSCFSILTCFAFKLHNNLSRLSTFVPHNSDTDVVTKKLLDNPKPHASLLPGGGMTQNGPICILILPSYLSRLVALVVLWMGLYLILKDVVAKGGLKGEKRRKTTGMNNIKSTCGGPEWLTHSCQWPRRWVVCLIWGAQSRGDIPLRDSPALLMWPCSSCHCDWLGAELAPSQQNPAPYECTMTPSPRGSRFYTSGRDLSLKISLYVT